MVHKPKHADDAELDLLFTAEEDTDEFRAVAAHVESCTICQDRLATKSGPMRFDDEARELLSGYPWGEPAREERDDECRAGHERTAALDFLSPPSHPEMLGRLGRYEIERVIGCGGMGVVLRAFDTELNRPVAIKVLARHLAHRGAARQRFARESRAAAAVVHEHVVAIHNVEADRDVPFLVMQFICGESLQARVDRDGPLDVKEILRIAIQAAAGLAAAHEQGVIHRDIKPGNILLENGVERVLITDFGLARTVDDASLTHTGVVAGTPHYMSPEQANGEVTDHRTDLFSLGAVLYFMATGHPPFRAERAMGVLNRICHDQHRPVWEVNGDVPDKLSEVIDRLLEKNAARRLATAVEVKATLVRLLAQLQQRGWRRSRVPRKVRRHPVLVSCGAFAIVGALMVTAAVCRPQFDSSSSRAAVTPEPVGASASASTHGSVATIASGDANRRAVLSAEVSTLSAEARYLSGQLDHLEKAAVHSRFVQSSGGEFWELAESLDVRLQRLGSDQ